MTAEEAGALATRSRRALRAAHERLRASFGEGIPAKSADERSRAKAGARRDRRRRQAAARLNPQLLRVRDGFAIHPKLARQLERRLAALDEGGIDWGQAESLAFASLLVDGIPIRLTGQDSERGTFSQRHLVFHDVRHRRDRIPMQRLDARDGLVRGLQLAALRVRVRRLRVRLLDGGAGSARALGGAVRRLRERRADDHRPVHLERAREVEADVTADAAAPARLRGQRPRAFERPPRAVPAARRAGEHARSSTARPPRSTSTFCAGRRSTRSRGRSS